MLPSAIPCLLLLAFLVSGSIIPPDDPNIRFIGRVKHDDSHKYSLDWSGVQIAAKFEGTSIGIYMQCTTDGSQFDVFIDNQLQKEVLKIKASNETMLYPLADHLTEGTHEIYLVKRTEASFGVVNFGGFHLDDGKKLVPYGNGNTRKIEMIGYGIFKSFVSSMFHNAFLNLFHILG